MPIKKFHTNKKHAVNDAVNTILLHPEVGEGKKGDLAGVNVYKFSCVKQEYLLAYEYDEKYLILLALGLHENFYRDLKCLH